MIPQMIRAGYSKEFSTAAAAAGGALGPIIPPSILFLLYGVATNTSVAKLFLAGAFPGILLGIAMIIIAKKISVKEKYVPGPEVKAELQKVWGSGIILRKLSGLCWCQSLFWAVFIPVFFLLPRLRLWPVCMHFLQVCSFIRT